MEIRNYSTYSNMWVTVISPPPKKKKNINTIFATSKN